VRSNSMRLSCHAWSASADTAADTAPLGDVCLQGRDTHMRDQRGGQLQQSHPLREHLRFAHHSVWLRQGIF
jgi:hypothetical protein